MNKGNGIAGLIVIVFILALCTIIGALLWPYTLNTWLTFFGKSATVVWWQGALLGLCPGIGQATIPIAVITWILMLIIG